jgi:beta-glucosidase
MKKFPNGFFWGAATASFQVEGGIENTDWAEAAREGRVPPAGRACDHYNRYEADFDIARDLGHNAHRFSIEWARIEPEEGKFNVEEIEHYRNVIRALKERGLRPYTTLWHFTLPLWFSESGGFERKDSPLIFARYARYVAEQLGDDLRGITTMNEPNVFASLGWIKGLWPPFKRFSLIERFRKVTVSGDLQNARPKTSPLTLFTYLKVCRHLAMAHNTAHDAIKTVRPDMEVSVVKHVVYFDAKGSVFNRLKAWVANRMWTHVFMRRVYRKCDSIGLNFYHYVTFGDVDTYPKTDIGWNIRPEGIYHALKLLWRYKKPLFVSEAGLADEHDVHRAEYITRQVQAVWKAIDEGVDVRGHMYWSLLDNYEWAFGYKMRFGLIEIDYETLERKIRPSAYIYKEICEKNAVV